MLLIENVPPNKWYVAIAIDVNIRRDESIQNMTDVL